MIRDNAREKRYLRERKGQVWVILFGEILHNTLGCRDTSNRARASTILDYCDGRIIEIDKHYYEGHSRGYRILPEYLNAEWIEYRPDSPQNGEKTKKRPKNPKIIEEKPGIVGYFAECLKQVELNIPPDVFAELTPDQIRKVERIKEGDLSIKRAEITGRVSHSLLRLHLLWHLVLPQSSLSDGIISGFSVMLMKSLN